MENDPNKSQVIILYPDAKCVITDCVHDKHVKFWKIISEDKTIGFSFISEEIAWERALLITNRLILDKLTGH